MEGELELKNLGHEGEGRGGKEIEEAARMGILRTDEGTSMVVYSLCRVTLGQAIVVVAGGTVFCLEAAWEGMTEEDRERFRQGAVKGAGWIDKQADIPMLARKLTRGGRWCAHKGYSREAKRAIRDPEAIAFGTVCPSQQSAGTIVVGGRPSDTAQYCDTCGGATEASRRCSPNGSGIGQEERSIYFLNMADKQLRQDMEEKAERDVDRQIREESIEPDEGAEPWMTIRQTTRRITEPTEVRGWGEQGSEATIRGESELELEFEEKDGRRPGSGYGTGGRYTEERWDRMEKWMMDNTRENTEVKRELERMCKLTQKEEERWEKMLETVLELREETYRNRRETIEGIGELKKWLAKLGNENKNGESMGFKNQTVIMDSLSKLHLNHNVSREDHKSIYREITMLETAMGSTVKAAVAEAVGRLSLELKRIFESLAENTPRPKESGNDMERWKRTIRGGQSQDTDTDTDTESGKEPRSWTAGIVRKRDIGTIGGRRGEQARGMRRPSGRESNPIILDTPKVERKENKGKGKVGRTKRSDKEAPGETETRGAKTPEAEVTREPDPTQEEDGGRDGSSSGGMPGRWDNSPTVSLDPTPIQGLTSPRRDLVPEEISAMRDKITISHIANEVPIEPELSPEPEEMVPTVTATVRYDKEKEEEMLRQVEDESKRQGEAEHRKEEERMLGRVLGTRREGNERGRRDRERTTKPGEGRDDKAAGRGGRGGEEKEEKMREGWCDQCKEGCGKKDGTKVTKQATQKEKEGEARKATVEATKGIELQRERKESGAIERLDWGEEGWREAGIEPRVPETPAAGGSGKRGGGVGLGDGSGQKTKEDDPILLNAPKGPRSLPRFCNLCKIHGHNDLTCHLQGNAPTPGPSRHQKPFKTVQQRTPRRGLGAPRGSANTGKEGGRRELGLTKREGIVFQKERQSAPSRKDPRKSGELLESEVEPELMKVERSEPEPRREGGGEERKEAERELEEGGEERKDKQTVKVHLKGCRAPPTATAKGKELEWKRSLRREVEAALKRADPGAQ